MLWILLAAAFSIIPIAVFLFTDTGSPRYRRFRCSHCGADTYVLEKDVCTSCHKTSEGEILEESLVKDAHEISPEELKSKRKTNRILIIVFSLLALGALTITIIKLSK